MRRVPEPDISFAPVIEIFRDILREFIAGRRPEITCASVNAAFVMAELAQMGVDCRYHWDEEHGLVTFSHPRPQERGRGT